jgi:hypothetical protein
MDTRRSYYVHSKRDDFAESAEDASRLDFDDVPFVRPANDNLRTKDRLSTRCGNLLRRLVARHTLRWPDYVHEQHRAIFLPSSIARTDR